MKTTMTVTCSVDKHNIVMTTVQIKRKPKLWVIVHLGTEITSIRISILSSKMKKSKYKKT